MKTNLVAVVLLLAYVGCANERLRVKVVDDEGNPVSNAMVHVGFTSGHVVFSEGKSHDYEARTGLDGNAVVKFIGSSSDVHWFVEADGFYRSEFRKEVFRIEVTQIPPIFYSVKMPTCWASPRMDVSPLFPTLLPQGATIT